MFVPSKVSHSLHRWCSLIIAQIPAGDFGGKIKHVEAARKSSQQKMYFGALGT